MGTFSSRVALVGLALSLLSARPAAAQDDAPGDETSLPTPEEAARTTTEVPPAEAGDEASADENEEEEDDGDRLRLFYLEVSAGYSWINLGAIRNDNLVPDIEQIKSSGYAVGAGFGFFVSFLTLGIQAEVARHDGFDFGTAVLDLGIRIPTPLVEPYIRAGLGFAWLFNPSGGLFEDAAGAVWEGRQAIRGVVLDVGLGFDFMINELVAIGVGADASLFNVRRSGADGSDVLSPTSIRLEDDGDSIGVQVSALLQLSLHF
ncbi:MAG: hypothetical protein AAGH15_09830 [Myxococcota bacterium]